MATVNPHVAGIAWEKPADLSRKEVLKRLSPSAVKAFLRICELWELRDEDARQMLGGISNGAFYELKRKARGTLDQDRLTRISLSDRDLQRAEHPLQQEARRPLDSIAE